MAVGCLQDGLYNLEDIESENYRKIIFLIEQLKLLAKHKQGRHYSPEMTIMSYRIRTASTAAYKVLLDENILCLPSLTTLSKVTRRCIQCFCICCSETVNTKFI